MASSNSPIHPRNPSGNHEPSSRAVASPPAVWSPTRVMPQSGPDAWSVPFVPITVHDSFAPSRLQPLNERVAMPLGKFTVAEAIKGGSIG